MLKIILQILKEVASKAMTNLGCQYTQFQIS